MIVGVLGGTFDPPHRGHLGLAHTVLETEQVDEVWLIPCLQHRFRKTPEAFDHRVAMCRLLIAGEPKMKVSIIESTLPRPGYTLELVLALRDRHPDYQFRLLAGADIYFERHKWHRYDEIARLAPPIYVGRRGVPAIAEPTLDAPIEVSSSNLRDALARGERPLEKLTQGVIDYIDAYRLYRG